MMFAASGQQTAAPASPYAPPNGDAQLTFTDKAYIGGQGAFGAAVTFAVLLFVLMTIDAVFGKSTT